MRSPFSIKLIYLIERRSFGQKYKFSNKNDMVSASRNFKNIFSRPLVTIIFRPEILKFHQYSIWSGETMVRFVIYCVLRVDQFILMFGFRRLFGNCSIYLGFMKVTEDYLDIFLLSTQCESRHALVQFVFFVMIVTSLGLLINSWLTVSHRLQKHKQKTSTSCNAFSL